MNSRHRRTTFASAFVALYLASASSCVHRQAQPAEQGSLPQPSILITTLRSSDRELGIQAAEELRTRLRREHSKDVVVHPKSIVDRILIASGFGPDAALSSADLAKVTSRVPREYVVGGMATPLSTGTGVRVEGLVLMRLVQTVLAQPLAPGEGKSLAQAARAVDHEIGQLLSGISTYEECIDDLRGAKNDAAAASARASIRLYPRSVFARACLLNAFLNRHAPPDSILSVAQQILAIDSTNLFALQNAADVYRAKGDTERRAEMNRRIYLLDAPNSHIADSLHPDIGLRSASPQEALQLIDSLLTAKPSDRELARTKWQLQLAAGRFREAIATGEELVKRLPAMATVDFYNRQIFAAQALSDTAKVLEIASKAAQAFPNDIVFPMLIVATHRKRGRPAETSPAAPSLVRNLGAMIDNAASSNRVKWAEAAARARQVDGIISSGVTKFYLGLASFEVGLAALKNAQGLGADTVKVCAEAKVAADMWAEASAALALADAGNRQRAESARSTIRNQEATLARLKKASCPPT